MTQAIPMPGVADGARPRPRVLWCVTSPITARAFLLGQLEHLEGLGVETALVCADDGRIADEVGTFFPWRVDREPSAVADLHSLADLVSTIRRYAPDTIVVGTPKAALLGMLAAVVARVPRRVYVVHGLRFEGFQGWRRRALQAVEALVSTLSTQTVAVSPSVARAVQSLAPWNRQGKILVLNHGSADGIDGERFHPGDPQEVHLLRQQLGLPKGPVVLFVGRLTGDKGVGALRHLASALEREAPEGILAVVGEPEPRTTAEAEDVQALLTAPNVIHVDHTDTPQLWLRAADVLAQPTRREGMPNVILEAQFSGLPVVSCAVTGVVDAVTDQQNGLLSAWGDTQQFVDNVLRVLREPGLADALAARALEGARERFDQRALRDVWAAFLRGER